MTDTWQPDSNHKALPGYQPSTCDSFDFGFVWSSEDGSPSGNQYAVSQLESIDDMIIALSPLRDSFEQEGITVVGKAECDLKVDGVLDLVAIF